MVSYGSSQRPAILDPWQTIVEVGWPPPWFAFALRINRRHPTNDNQPYAKHEIACSPDDAIPGGFAALDTLKNFQWQYTDLPADLPRVWRGGSWEGIIEVESHEGLPALPILHEFGFPEWFVELRSPANFPLKSFPRARWDEPAGAEHGADLPVPGNPDMRFVIPNQNLTLRMYGTAPTAGDICIGGIRKALAPLPDPLPWDVPFSPLEINIDNVRVRILNRDWRAVAVARQPDEDETDNPITNNPSTTGVMWVLCEPDEGTP